MSERQSLIEQLTGHPVASLRDLTFSEANDAIDALVARKSTQGAAKTAWDNRGGDTWIDRL